MAFSRSDGTINAFYYQKEIYDGYIKNSLFKAVLEIAFCKMNNSITKNLLSCPNVF